MAKIILGIDTAFSDQVSLAILKEREICGHLYLKAEESHCEKLILLLEELLSKNNFSLNDLNIISCLKGPGSFSGLRVGTSFAKTVAQQLKIPLTGISTLEALVYPFSFLNGLIITMMKAARGDVNFSIFANRNNCLECFVDDSVISQELFLEKLSKVRGNLYFVNFDFDNFFKKIKELNPQTKIVNIDFPKSYLAISTALLGLEKFYSRQIDDPLTLLPRYSHQPMIKKWSARHCNYEKK